LLCQRSKDLVAISNPSARQQAIRVDTRASQSPCLFGVTTQCRVAPADTERLRGKPLDNRNASGDGFGNDRLKCPGCSATASAILLFADVRVRSGLRRKRLRCQKSNQCTSNDIVLISTGHRFTFSEVLWPSEAGQSSRKVTMKPTSIDAYSSARISPHELEFHRAAWITRRWFDRHSAHLPMRTSHFLSHARTVRVQTSRSRCRFSGRLSARDQSR
jgi:hypothetical protein